MKPSDKVQAQFRSHPMLANNLDNCIEDFIENARLMEFDCSAQQDVIDIVFSFFMSGLLTPISDGSAFNKKFVYVGDSGTTTGGEEK